MSTPERRIQAAVLAAAAGHREVERVGPFTATFATGSANPFLNYAIPDEGAAPTAEDVTALAAAYERRDRTPRLEYLPALAPTVEPALLAAGFEVEARAALLVLRAPSTAAAPFGIELVEAVEPAEILAAVSAQHEAYGEEDPPSEAWLAGVRKSIDAGGLLVLARDAGTGEPAGAGQCTPPHEGATELTSVGVRPAYRRRGVAAAMTAWLAQRMRTRGADLVFLMAVGEAEKGIYERVGFAAIGEVLFVGRPLVSA